MPEISTYMGHIDVDIDVDDFLEQCGDGDIDDIIEILQEKYPQKFKSSESVFDNEPGLIYETRKKMFELAQHAHKFTPEEESFLETMYSNYL
jgi:hypothetical protein